MTSGIAMLLLLGLGAASADLPGQETPVSMWRQAIEPHPFQFPADHAAHDDYRIEWWYYTGNLAASDGRQFGYQLTFFRTGVVYAPENPSRWAIRDLHMAHFAVSDIDNAEFFMQDRLRREGVGGAGARTDRFEAWNGNWRVKLVGDAHRLSAETDAVAIDLNLLALKPPVLHGRGGLSQKGPSVGNASHYYSLTRMQTDGKIRMRGETLDVAGLSWMDHEFSTSFLEPGQQGWDWFSLQLDNDCELMIYRIRRGSGEADRHSAGTVVDAAGKGAALAHDEFMLEPGRTWKSPVTGAVYAISWTVGVKNRGIELEVEAAFPAQELDTRATTGIAYWEGSVRARGRWGGRTVTGRGYLEMTGYAGRALGGSLEGGR